MEALMRWILVGILALAVLSIGAITVRGAEASESREVPGVAACSSPANAPLISADSRAISGWPASAWQL